jgi:hypothetical protein
MSKLKNSVGQVRTLKIYLGFQLTNIVLHLKQSPDLLGVFVLVLYLFCLRYRPMLEEPVCAFRIVVWYQLRMQLVGYMHEKWQWAFNIFSKTFVTYLTSAFSFMLAVNGIRWPSESRFGWISKKAIKPLAIMKSAACAKCIPGQLLHKRVFELTNIFVARIENSPTAKTECRSFRSRRIQEATWVKAFGIRIHIFIVAHCTGG